MYYTPLYKIKLMNMSKNVCEGSSTGKLKIKHESKDSISTYNVKFRFNPLLT